jgi:SAM-dependent methyltransferase
MTPAPSLQRPGGPLATETGLLQRLVAGGYDWLFDCVDSLGGADHRRRLVEQAAGEVLEIGAGTGRNLPLYRTATRVVALEPGPGMRVRAEQAARAAQLPVEVVDGRAEALPFPDASFDTVIASLVLCTVADPAQALTEAHRVLRPGGTLRFYQHVRADDPRLARWQDRLERPWGWLALGCHPNRDIVAAITAAGFRVLELDRFDFQIMPPLVRPHILGVAQRPTHLARLGLGQGHLGEESVMANENVDLVRRAYQAYANGDPGAMLELVDPDLEWTYLDPNLAHPTPQVCHGRQELEGVLRGWTEHGLRAELEEVAGRGELVMVGVRVPGIDAHHGRRGDDRAYGVITVRGGRIVALRDCHDRQEALTVTGIR